MGGGKIRPHFSPTEVGRIFFEAETSVVCRFFGALQTSGYFGKWWTHRSKVGCVQSWGGDYEWLQAFRSVASTCGMFVL